MAESTKISNMSATLNMRATVDPNSAENISKWAYESAQSMSEAEERLWAESLQRVAEAEAKQQERMRDSEQAQSRLNDHIISQRMRVMNTEDRINTEHERRVQLIMQETNLTEEQTRELIRQSEITRQMAMTKYADVIQQEKINAAAKASGQFARMGGVMQEVGRGMEDFIVGMSMGSTAADGLALGLRGSANNIAQMASYAGPMVGAFAAIGASLGAIIVPKIVEWATATDQIDKNVKQYEEWLDRSKRRAREGASDVFAFGRMESSEDFKKELDRRKEDVSVAFAELKQARIESNRVNKELQSMMAENAETVREARAMAPAAFVNPLTLPLILPDAISSWMQTKSTTELEKKTKAAIESALKSDKEVEDKRAALARARKFEEDVLARERAVNDKKNRDKMDKDAIKADTLSQRLLSQLVDESVRATNDKRLQYEHEYNENVAQINEMTLEDKKKKEELYLQNRNLYATRMDELMAEENKKATEKVAKDQEREIDRQIFEAEQKLQSTRELMQGSQSRNTSSSALIAGTQQADAILNRAMAGSRTQEDTLKKSLDVQQKQLKELREMKRSNRLGIANIGQGA